MIDLKTLQDELNHVRLARLDAEAAEREVEETDLAGPAFRARQAADAVHLRMRRA